MSRHRAAISRARVKQDALAEARTQIAQLKAENAKLRADSTANLPKVVESWTAEQAFTLRSIRRDVMNGMTTRQMRKLMGDFGSEVDVEHLPPFERACYGIYLDALNTKFRLDNPVEPECGEPVHRSLVRTVNLVLEYQHQLPRPDQIGYQQGQQQQ